MRGVHIGTLYNTLRRIVSDGLKNYVVSKSGVEEGKPPTSLVKNTILWHQILGHNG